MKLSEEGRAPQAPLWRLLMEIGLILAVIVLAALRFLPREDAVPSETQEPAEAVEVSPALFTLRLHGMDKTETLSFAPGDRFVPPDAPLEGYTFLRWQTGRGDAVAAEGMAVWEDADLYPVYAMKLGRADHAPYLSLDEHGAFHPGDPLSRREVVQILYFLLDTDLVGDGSFLDLPKKDPLYPAAATLKQLGILSGSRLHPDETVTRREFLDMLCALFPRSSADVEFSDLSPQDEDYDLFRSAAALGWIESGPETAARPDEELTRLELASILSAAMDRHGDKYRRSSLVGTILDLRSDDAHFWDVAEAVIPHRASGTGAEERWTRCTPLPQQKEGFFFLGTDLHAIDEHGDPVVNGSYAGVSFDGEGVVTSGDPELDRLVRDLLPRLVDPSDMTREEMLEKLFIYTLDQLRYRKGNYYPPGEPAGWEIAEAKSALSRKAGNCYSFAAAFCVLARAVGYPAEAYTGSIRTETTPLSNSYTDIHGEEIVLPARRCPHGWVEIEMDGESLIFDPELSFRLFADGSASPFIFKAGAAERRSYAYSTERDDPDPLSPEASPAVAATP